MVEDVLLPPAQGEAALVDEAPAVPSPAQGEAQGEAAPAATSTSPAFAADVPAGGDAVPAPAVEGGGMVRVSGGLCPRELVAVPPDVERLTPPTPAGHRIPRPVPDRRLPPQFAGGDAAPDAELTGTGKPPGVGGQTPEASGTPEGGAPISA